MNQDLKDSDDADLYALHTQGWPLEAIAERLKTSRELVRQRITRYRKRNGRDGSLAKRRSGLEHSD
jgi:transposase